MRLLPALAATLLLAAGCGGAAGGAAAGRAAAAVAKVPPVCRSGRKVPLVVVHGGVDATLVLVPVTIGGKGPYTFALDTGATKSAISRSLAQKLHLRVVGPGGRVQGVGGDEKAKLVSVPSWKVGSVSLKSWKLASLRLFGGSASPKGPQGLLGSDILSRFSAVCIDYHSSLLRLGAGP